MTEIKAKVKIGTLQYEAGTYQKDAVIYVSEERFKLFDPKDVEFISLNSEPVEVEAKPLGVANEKPAKKKTVKTESVAEPETPLPEASLDA